MSSFTISAVRELFRGYLVRLDEVSVEGGGTSFTREIVRHPGAVAVIPVDADGYVTLIQQYRAAAGGEIIEITAGTCDVDGEDLLTTARRELEEEVGLAATTFELLGVVMNSPGYCDQRTAVYLATDLHAVPRAPAGPEEVAASVRRLPLHEVVTMVDVGQIVDATTCYGILMAARRHGI